MTIRTLIARTAAASAVIVSLGALGAGPAAADSTLTPVAAYESPDMRGVDPDSVEDPSKYTPASTLTETGPDADMNKIPGNLEDADMNKIPGNLEMDPAADEIDGREGTG